MVVDQGQPVVRERGNQQGGVVSPLLANLFLHYALDAWLRRHMRSVRFCRRITSYNVCYTKLLRNVGRDRHSAHNFHEALGVVVLVRAQRDPLAPAERIHKFHGSLPFGRARRLRDLGLDYQATPVLHQ